MPSKDYFKWLYGSQSGTPVPYRPSGQAWDGQVSDEYSMGGRPIVSEQLTETYRLPPGYQSPYANSGYSPSGEVAKQKEKGNGRMGNKTQFGIAAGASALGGLYSWIAANERLKELKKRGADLTPPPAMREALSGLRMAAQTSRLPDQTYQEGQIAKNQTAFNRNVARTANSSSQALIAMGGAQQVAEQARARMAAEGLNNRQINERLYRQGLMTKAQYEAAQKQLYENSLAALYNAKQQAIGNSLTGVSQAALLAL